MVKLLLEHGADVSTRDVTGNTALTDAEEFNFTDIASLSKAAK